MEIAIIIRLVSANRKTDLFRPPFLLSFVEEEKKNLEIFAHRIVPLLPSIRFIGF